MQTFDFQETAEATRSQNQVEPGPANQEGELHKYLEQTTILSWVCSGIRIGHVYGAAHCSRRALFSLAYPVALALRFLALPLRDSFYCRCENVAFISSRSSTSLKAHAELFQVQSEKSKADSLGGGEPQSELCIFYTPCPTNFFEKCLQIELYEPPSPAGSSVGLGRWVGGLLAFLFQLHFFWQMYLHV